MPEVPPVMITTLSFIRMSDPVSLFARLIIKNSNTYLTCWPFSSEHVTSQTHLTTALHRPLPDGRPAVFVELLRGTIPKEVGLEKSHKLISKSFKT
jgi:hypothetical protein